MNLHPKGKKNKLTAGDHICAAYLRDLRLFFISVSVLSVLLSFLINSLKNHIVPVVSVV